MIVVLAEKPSVARDIARFLGCNQRRDGYFEGARHQVTWAFGHLVGLRDAGEYDPALKAWRLETLPFIPERFELKVVSDSHARKQFTVVKRLFKAADELLCATDAGREGELIFRYLVQITNCRRKPFRRLWLSSLTDEALRRGFADLRPGNEFDALFDAARCRAEADWIVGINATRAYTVRHGGHQVLWSVGRVQTPLLAMIVRRDDTIRHFEPEPFWELYTRYRSVIFRFTGDRFAAEAPAAAVRDRIAEAPFRITRVAARKQQHPPPQLYDLTDLQRDMNRRYSLAAATTLKLAQSLYESKVITYPRTDSRYLGNDMKPEIPGILRDLSRSRGPEIARLDLAALRFSRRIIDDAKVTDHHAIIPTGKVPSGLGEGAGKVYDAIVTRLIAAFYPDCVKEVTTVDGCALDVPFRARGVVILDPGWTALYPKPQPKPKDGAKPGESGTEQELPQFTVGETGPHTPYIKQGTTKPPPHYSENTLLAAMETAGREVDDEAIREAMKERGLGTPATRAAMIETLLTRNYISRQGKTLVATTTGRFLIALVGFEHLKSPEMTGDWEAKLAAIQRRQLPPAQFMAEIGDFIRAVVADRDRSVVDPSQLGPCPRCGHPAIRGKRGYGCSQWREGCGFVLWPEHADLTLSEPDIRELLQRRSLGRAVRVRGADAFLALGDDGHIIELPVSDAANRAPGRGGGGRGGGRGGGGNSDRGGKRQRASRQGDADSAPRAAADSLGSCPLCQAPVEESAKAFGCSKWREGCRFTIWKKLAGKTIGKRTAAALLTKGSTGVLKGFTAKSGKSFDAALKLVDGKVEFDFPERPQAG